MVVLLCQSSTPAEAKNQYGSSHTGFQANLCLFHANLYQIFVNFIKPVSQAEAKKGEFLERRKRIKEGHKVGPHLFSFLAVGNQVTGDCLLVVWWQACMVGSGLAANAVPCGDVFLLHGGTRTHARAHKLRTMTVDDMSLPFGASPLPSHPLL